MASAGLLARIVSQAQSANNSTPIHGLRHGRHRSPSREWTRALVLEFRTSLAGDLVRRQVRIMGRKAYCFARSSPLRAQAGLAYPVLYRNGAPGTIRTSDPQIRSLFLMLLYSVRPHAI